MIIAWLSLSNIDYVEAFLRLYTDVMYLYYLETLQNDYLKTLLRLSRSIILLLSQKGLF